MTPLMMSSAVRIDQQLLCASKSLSPEIPLAAWGGVLNPLLRSSSMTTENLLQSWLRSRSMSLEQVQETDRQNLYLTYVAATTILASQDEPSDGTVTKACCQTLLIPALRGEQVLSFSQIIEVTNAFSTLIAAGGCWSLAAEILDQALAVFQSADALIAKPGLREDEDELFARQLHARCSLVEALLSKAAEGVKLGQLAAVSAKQFLQHGLTCLQSLLVSSINMRESRSSDRIGHVLLPLLVQVALLLGTAESSNLADTVWTACRDAFGEESSSSHNDAASVMVKTVDVLLPAGPQSEQQGIHGDPAFWQILQKLAVGTDSVACKRGRFLLQRATQGMPESQGWAALLQLLAQLEDFAQHLIKDAWQPLLLRVHSAALQSHIQPDPGRQAAGGVLDCSWLVCLWKRGFNHPNPQVQKHILESLLRLQWPSQSMAVLPEHFVVVHVLQTFCKGCLGGVADSALLNSFLQHYSSVLNPARAVTFASQLLHSLNASNVMKAAQLVMLEATLQVATKVNKVVSHQADQLWFEDAVQQLKSITKSASMLGSRQRQQQACQRVLSIAKLLLPADMVQLEMQASLLVDIPQGLLCSPGPVSQAAQDWCMPDGATASTSLAGLNRMFESYFTNRETGVEENVDADAARCSVALLVLAPWLSQAVLDRLLQPLQERVAWLGSRPYLPPGVPLRSLILLNALVQVGQLTYDKPATDAGCDAVLQSLPGFIHSLVAYLPGYALHCANVFSSSPDRLNELLPLPQVVGAISEAAPSRLSLKLQSSVNLAELAFNAVCSCCILLTTILASQSQPPAGSPHHHAAHDLHQMSMCLAAFITVVATNSAGARAHPAHVTAATAELQSRQLSSLALCCSTLCSLPRTAVKALKLEHQAAQLLEVLLEGCDQAGLAGAAVSKLQLATWQALYPLLSLLCCGEHNVVASGIMGSIIAKAASQAQTVPSAALVPLMQTLRLAFKQAASQAAAAAAAVHQWRPTTSRELALARPHTASESGTAGEGASADTQHAADLAEIIAATSAPCWQAIEEEDRLRPHQYQVFLQTFLAPELFNNNKPSALRCYLHEEQGPLRKLVQKLLHLGRRNARLATALVLQLSQLFLACPAVALLYEEELLQLMLADSKDACSSAEADEAGTAGSSGRKLQGQLLNLDPNLAETLANLELSPRIATVYLMYHLAATADQRIASEARLEHDVTAAADLGWSLWQQLVSKVQTDPVLSAANYRINSAVHRAKVRAWQACAVLSAFIPAEPATATEAAIDQLWPYLQREMCRDGVQSKEVSSVRQYMEAILVNLALRDPLPFMQARLLPALRSYHHKQHEGITSAMLIACQLVRHAPHHCQEQMLAPLVAAMWPWTMWHHHAIRTLAQLVLHRLLEEFPEAVLNTSASSPSSGYDASPACPWQACLDFFRSNPDMKRLERSMGPGLALFNPAQAIAPLAVFLKGSQLAGEGALTVERAPASLLDSITTFLIQQRAGLRQQAQTLLADRVSDVTPGKQFDIGPAHHTDFQRKMTPLDNLLASPQEIAAAEQLGELLQPQHQEAKRQELIVVASLIDKLPNLAGLTRTCEVFRAAALVISDRNIARDPLFASISVTAEQWVPLIEVQTDKLTQWMAQKKAEGFLLVGLEQTAESITLPQFNFATKSVLLLGREREGIPADMLEIVDHTVEIPQLGLIRSLNVHVSGAIAMYEYSRQQSRAADLH